MNVQVIKILILISLKYHYPRNKQTHTTLVAMKAYMLGPVTSSRHVVLFTIYIIINLKFPLYICVKYGYHKHLIISHSSQILLNIFIPGVRKTIIKIIHSKPSQKRNGTVWNSILNVMTDFDIKIKCTFQPKLKRKNQIDKLWLVITSYDKLCQVMICYDKLWPGWVGFDFSGQGAKNLGRKPWTLRRSFKQK